MNEQMNVPKLRFDEFDGEWDEVSISSLGKIVTGSTPPTSDPSNYLGDRLFISPADLDGRKYISSTKTTLSQKGFDSGRLLPSGSVCFVCIGSTIGKVAINSEDAISNQQINAVVVNHKNYNSDFVYSRLTKDSPRIKLLAGEQAVPILNKSSFGKVKVFTPHLQEQQKIASFLSKVDEKITLLSEKKAKLTEYKKGVMQQLFDGSFQEQGGKLVFVPPTLRFKADDGSEFPDWEEKSIGDVLTIGNGKDYKHLSEGSVPVFGTGGHMLSVDDYLYDGETVFIGRKGTINKPYMFEGKFWTVDTLFYTKDFVGVLPKFVYLIFQQINWSMYNEATGVPSLSKSTICKIKNLIPSIHEQTKITSFIHAIDQKIELTNTELEKAKEWKKGLLQQMFV
ncbi:restriction endonuclease subunit S [Vibrio alfacsensis]|uniref:restriction endonuclease subunit S n=1 Tax=Vibrio alfacsensis TaxID=1074311 RepID=UPI004068F0EB